MQLLYYTILLILLCSCTKEQTLSLKHSNKNKLIAIQPIGHFASGIIIRLENILSKSYNAEVILLNEIEMPPSLNVYEDKYSGDSLLKMLSIYKNGNVAEVIGLTHKEVYVPKFYNKSTPAALKMVKGYGFISEGVCIISDYSMGSTNEELAFSRLYKAIKHEVGHNLGLQHCQSNTCIMNEQSGDILFLDKISGEYCNSCRKKLH
jgi:Predicted Zn-dependent proteases